MQRATIAATWLTAYLFLAPGLLLFAVFRVYPLLEGLRLSFTNARLGRATYSFVGLANYARLLDDTRFQVSLVNTAFYTVASTLPILAIPLLSSPLALNRGRAAHAPAQRLLLPVHAVGGDGGAHVALAARPRGRALQLLPEGPRGAGALVACRSAHRDVGDHRHDRLVGDRLLPRDLPGRPPGHPARALRGGRHRRRRRAGARFWAITLPLLRPVFLFVFVTHIIGSFQIFGQVFVLTMGGPGDATRTVVQHLYETAFQNFFQFGSASAMAWVLFAIILVFSLLQFRLLRGHTEY